MNYKKVIKDLKERNDKLQEQYRLRDIRCIHLEYENEMLKSDFKAQHELTKKYAEESKELNQKYLNAVVDYEITMSDKTELEKQLEYLRSGEYLNQLRFERDMLQDLVDKKEISKEDKEFIDMTRRNTELLEQQKEFIKWLEDEKNRLARELSNLYEDSLGHTRLVNEDIFDEVNDILQKYKSIIGDDK